MSTYYDNSAYGASNQLYGAQGAPQPTYNHSTYQPPRDDYRHDMAVARYDDDPTRYDDERDYDDRRSHSGRDRYSDARSRSGRRSAYDERERSRSRRRSDSRRDSERGLFGGEKHEDHRKSKDVGATLVGGAVGAFAGHEFGHKNKMVSTIGALAGAFAGHELEKRHEKKKERRQSEQESFEYQRRRESFSDSREIGDGYDQVDYDERPHHHRKRHDWDRYD